MAEKRKHKRFKSKLLVVTIHHDEKDKIVVNDEIYSEDIGAGGIRIAFPKKLPKGKIVDLKLFLFSDLLISNRDKLKTANSFIIILNNHLLHYPYLFHLL